MNAKRHYNIKLQMAGNTLNVVRFYGTTKASVTTPPFRMSSWCFILLILVIVLDVLLNTSCVRLINNRIMEDDQGTWDIFMFLYRKLQLSWIF